MDRLDLVENGSNPLPCSCVSNPFSFGYMDRLEFHVPESEPVYSDMTKTGSSFSNSAVVHFTLLW